VVADRYRLLTVIGRGGMGRVWRAHDLLLDRDVAVKEVLPVAGLPTTPQELTKRTMREARAAARLTHPHAVAVFDVAFAEGRAWIVMELVAGSSLDARVRRDGPLAVAEVIRIGRELLDVLDAAHDAGILHRDIKPHNILITDDGRVKLGDFGVAGTVPRPVGGSGGARTRATRPDVTLASPAYVAPERAADGASTIETDLWSLGATLYFAVEGRPPYDRADLAEQLAALASEPPDPPLRAGPLAPVLDGLLERAPDRRLSAAQARTRLESAAAAPVPGARRVGAVSLTRARRAAARTSRIAAVLILATILGVVGAVGVAAARSIPIAVFVTGGAPVLPPGCDATDNGAAPVADVGGTALPPGWVRTGTDRFTVGVPQQWRRSGGGGLICLRGSDAGQAFTAEAAAPAAGGHVAFWQREEQLILRRGVPAHYRRIAIAPVAYRTGAADWEYTYDNDGLRWHVRKRHFTVGSGQTFVVSWTTTDAGWLAQQGTFTTIMAGFDPR
jgi:hypothetical protein